VSTTPTPWPIKLNTTEPAAPTCSGNTYVTQSGDTCDSIAQSNKISAGTLYYNNPLLVGCSSLAAGTQLCLPSQCESQYSIKEGDECVSVALALGISWQQIVSWNSMVDCTGANMRGDGLDWGSLICVSPPGGAFTTPPANETGTGTGGQGGSGDGYGKELVDVPAGASLAPQTTTKCGGYYAVKTGDTCASILVTGNASAALFVAANPWLRSSVLCDSRLIVGRTYCLYPLRNFDKVDSTPTPRVLAANSAR
jgi:LysM repeat protein